MIVAALLDRARARARLVGEDLDRKWTLEEVGRFQRERGLGPHEAVWTMQRERLYRFLTADEVRTLEDQIRAYSRCREEVRPVLAYLGLDR